MSFVSSTHALAMDGWVNGKPVFESDRRRGGQYGDRERQSQYNTVFPEFMDGGGRPPIVPEAPPMVTLANAEPAGTIIIDTGGRRLYYVLPGNKAYEYPISVGREGFDWTGTETHQPRRRMAGLVSASRNAGAPTGLPKKMTGGMNNPLGAKSLYLGNTLYRIHGTNDPTTIGLASSSGCFRMMNQHVDASGDHGRRGHASPGRLALSGRGARGLILPRRVRQVAFCWLFSGECDHVLAKRWQGCLLSAGEHRRHTPHPRNWLEVRPGGLYCAPARAYIDPTRAVDRAIITHGHADHARPGHRAVLATRGNAANHGRALWRGVHRQPPGRRLWRSRSIATMSASRCCRPGISSAARRSCSNMRGACAIVSGDYKRRADPTCAGFELARCDIFITEATFGLPVFRHPPVADEIEKLLKIAAPSSPSAATSSAFIRSANASG